MATEAELSSRGFVIMIFGVAALLCCGVPAGSVYLYRKDTRDEPGIRAAADAYLSAVVRHDYNGAYDMLCAADRRRESRADWLDRPAAGYGVTGFRITDVTIERPSETPTLRWVTAEVTYSDQAPRTVHLNVEQQDGDWKVCSPDVR
ncbi:Rv0361 family membrane protein [Micromonospora sp. NBC_00421]|uniref:Rv0361 family membrane protein n=1 Tax=Micromonospora sp. NBC_00421 TaxID=2975976 RepID=UPI002E2272F0